MWENITQFLQLIKSHVHIEWAHKFSETLCEDKKPAPSRNPTLSHPSNAETIYTWSFTWLKKYTYVSESMFIALTWRWIEWTGKFQRSSVWSRTVLTEYSNEASMLGTTFLQLWNNPIDCMRRCHILPNMVARKTSLEKSINSPVNATLNL